MYFAINFFFQLQVISLEGWVDIMYYVQDAHSFWDWIYFVLLIVVSTEIITTYTKTTRVFLATIFARSVII